MAQVQAPPEWNYRRRAAGAAICLSPVALLVASLVAGLEAPRESWMGLRLALFALIPTALNVFCALRPQLYVWRYGSMEGYRNISGAPLFGTICAVLAGAVGFGDWRAAAIGLFVLAFDFGGLPWLLVSTWRDPSFWDA